MFFRDYWNNFQYDFLGPSSVTIIANAAKARSQGIEAEIQWQPIKELTFTANAASTDARLTANYCGQVYTNGSPVTNCGPGNVTYPNPPEAPSGTPLPVTPPFKGNLTARYSFPVGNLHGYAEGALVYQDGVWSDLRLVTYNSSNQAEPIRGRSVSSPDSRTSTCRPVSRRKPTASRSSPRTSPTRVSSCIAMPSARADLRSVRGLCGNCSAADDWDPLRREVLEPLIKAPARSITARRGLFYWAEESLRRARLARNAECL